MKAILKAVGRGVGLVAPATPEAGKLAFIDAVRGLAILMVILVHTAQAVPGRSKLLEMVASYGQMGVQLFFIASAFTLCKSWLGREHEQNKTANYFIRRYFRIAPIYYIGILIYFPVSIYANYRVRGIAVPDEQYTVFNVMANVLLVHGFVPSANNGIVPGGWSIGTEFAFYALFPFVVRWFSKNEDRLTPRFLVGVVLASIALTMVAALALFLMTGKGIENGDFFYYNLINQQPVFVMGIAYFFASRKDMWPARSKAGNLVCFVLTTLVSVGLFYSGIPHVFSIVPAAAGLSFLFLVEYLRRDTVLNNRLVRRIGVVSYSMYVFHFLFAWTMTVNATRRAAGHLPPDALVLACYLLAVAFTFVIALMSEQWIERPFIRLGKRLVTRLRARPPRREISEPMGTDPQNLA